MFTYISLGTNDLTCAATFHDAVLGALGLTRCSTILIFMRRTLAILMGTNSQRCVAGSRSRSDSEQMNRPTLHPVEKQAVNHSVERTISAERAVVFDVELRRRKP